jgi:hypothetical protein
MGTDISMYVEIERNGTWQILTEVDENSTSEGSEIYYGRQNYRLFAILVDMRNPPTWGTVNHQAFDFISKTRGLPKDLSLKLRDWTMDVDGDWKVLSPGWLLLSEVLEFDWYGKVMTHQDLVNPALAHLFEESKPFPYDKWPKDVSMNYWNSEDWVIARWTETYAESAEDFMRFLDMLKQYGEPSKLRLVFCFEH